MTKATAKKILIQMFLDGAIYFYTKRILEESEVEQFYQAIKVLKAQEGEG
jgi:hypothetical protein